MKQKSFKPAFGLSNKHIQTLYSSLFRKKISLDFEVECFKLPDGDFVDCYWLNKPSPKSDKPIVILFHGLAGSYESPYIQGAMKKLSQANFSSVVMHFRGCSGRANKLPRAYHSGETQDALNWIKHLKNSFPNSKLFSVGFSIGGNMLLKLLGEMGKDSILNGAISISAPLELNICADSIDKGFSKIYQKHLLKNLNISLKKKYEIHDMQKFISLKKEDIDKIENFWEFDDLYTAPIHGFSSAKDYYEKSSSKQFLKDIKTKTLIIHSLDDPFMTPKILPTKNQISSYIELEITKYGGHVGFISGSFISPDYWLDNRIVNYFKSFKMEKSSLTLI